MSEEIKDETLAKATTEGAFVVGGVGGVIDPAASLGNAPVVNYGQFGTPTSVAPSGTNTVSGILPPEAANRFIDYIWDATVLAKEGRHVTMRANTMELSKVNIGERIIRAANQADGDYINTGAKFSKIELTTKKIRLDWEMSAETLEDGIEGPAFEDHIVRLMTNQFANDIEDLAINGVGDQVDPFLGIMKGFIIQAKQGGHEVVNSDAVTNWTPEVLQSMIDALPRRFRALKSGYRFYTGSTVFGNIVRNNGTNANLIYTESMRQSYLNGGDQIMGAPGTMTRVLGVPVIEIPYYPEDYIELTFPQNRVWGLQREIKIGREYKLKKDTTEWVVYMRFGLAWEELDAMAWMDANGSATTTTTTA